MKRAAIKKNKSEKDQHHFISRFKKDPSRTGFFPGETNYTGSITVSPSSQWTVEAPDSRSEKEADSFAERFSNHPATPDFFFGQKAAQKTIHTSGAAKGFSLNRIQETRVDSVLKESGVPLPLDSRKSFEQSLGQDFGRVRIHTGNAAEKAAESLQAKAFAVGNDIVFGSGHYNPGTKEGDHLLAHEMAHVARSGETKTVHRAPTEEEKRKWNMGHHYPRVTRNHATESEIKEYEAAKQRDLEKSQSRFDLPTRKPQNLPPDTQEAIEIYNRFNRRENGPRMEPYYGIYELPPSTKPLSTKDEQKRKKGHHYPPVTRNHATESEIKEYEAAKQRDLEKSRSRFDLPTREPQNLPPDTQEAIEIYNRFERRENGPRMEPYYGMIPSDEPSDLDLALFSDHTYHHDTEMPEGASIVYREERTKIGLGKLTLSDGESGFRSTLYKTRNDWYVYAISGTYGLGDEKGWNTNYLQGQGKPAKQYEIAAANGELLKGCKVRNRIKITGHSLGGGLASLASIKSGIKAVTFNAAGLHPATIVRYVKEEPDPNGEDFKRKVKTLIKSYVRKGEALNTVQGLIDREAAGERITLSDFPEDLVQQLVVLGGAVVPNVYLAYKNHLMPEVIETMRKELKNK